MIISSPNIVLPNNESAPGLPAFTQVARGLVTGATSVNLSGYQASVGTSFIPLWENATAYTYPVSATTMLLYSSSASDTAVSVLISGLDASYNPISETLVCTGTAGVTSVNSYLRINGLTITGANNAVGNIILSNAGKTVTYAQITAGVGKSQACIYTVPNGYTFYLLRSNFYTNQIGTTTTAYATYRVYTSLNGIQQVLLTAPFSNNYSALRVVPRAYAAKTDIQWQFNTPTGTAAIGGTVEGILLASTAS
jgi:hypothetical protein